MKRPRVFPLHFHIWIAFAALLLAVGGIASGAAYLITREGLESATSDAIGRISRETLHEVDGIVAPAETAVRLISHSSLDDAQTLDARLAQLPMLRDALEISPALQALYVGYGTGDFFFLRRVMNDAQRALLHAPERARYVLQVIAHGKQGAEGRFIYLDEALTLIKTTEQPAYAAKFDPRNRPWYVDAISSGRLIRTDPYVFYSDRGVGATIAISTPDRRGVVGGDLRLDALGQILAAEKSTEHTLIALLDGDGRLLASGTDIGMGRAANGPQDSALVRPANQYGSAVLTHLAAKAAALGNKSSLQEELTVDGSDWYMSVARIVPVGGKPLFLVSAIPMDELLSGAKREGLAAVGLTLLVILAAIPLTWLYARAVSRPLRGLAGEAESIRRFEFGEWPVTRSSVSEVNALSLAMDEMRLAIRRFLDITRAMAAEPHLDRLIPMLVRETMQVAGGTTGALYLLRNDVMEPASAWTREKSEMTSALSKMPLAAAPAFVREAVANGATRTSTQPHDGDTKSLLDLLSPDGSQHMAAIPLINRQRDPVGVMLLLRATPFQAPELAFVSALAGLSANALEIRGLVKAQSDLFDAFIRLIAGAIDAKSPHTGGHCARVPELVKLIAKAACDAREGPFASFDMSETDWEALHVAAWLHDCGKVTTPEYVIDKATKLETLYDRIHEIRTRFEVLKRDAEIRYLQSRLDGAHDATARAQRDIELSELDDDFAFVAACNQGAEHMDDAHIERLERIGSRRWLRTLDDRVGISHEALSRKERTASAQLPVLEPLIADKPEHHIERSPSDRIAPDNPWGFKLDIPEFLYNRGELHNLSVARGTLSREERYKIEEHIVQTQVMLSRLTFPKHLRAVPEIAGNHHETMVGTGYPRRLARHDMSIPARMMAIADVFEALTAKDRPYKRAKTLSESVSIMASMTKRGHIDPDLFELFLVSGAYRTYAQAFMGHDQIDEVDIQQYVSPKEPEASCEANE